MKTEEQAYIAGIIDGEGSILLTRQSKTQHPSPCITVASTDIELLNWLKTTIGRGTLIQKKNYNPKRHKNSFTYTLIRDAAIDLLKEIEPYLIIHKKKARAQHIINNYKKVTVRNGKYTSCQLKAKEQFYNDFMAL